MDARTERYRGRARAHEAARDALRRTSVALSRWRLATFLPALALLVWALRDGEPWLFGSAAVLFLVFGALVVRHARVDERADWFEARRVVNERAIARVHRNWDGLPVEDPAVDDQHPYAVDLDLFGRASLFQWLGPAATTNGGQMLAAWLLAPAAPDVVGQRQQAVDELAPMDEWRELLAAHGAVVRDRRPLPLDSFLAWAESTQAPLPFYGAVRVLVGVLTVAIPILIGLHATGVAPALWAIPVLAGIVLSFITAVPVQRAFDRAGAGQRALKQYAAIFEHLCGVRFQSAHLQSLRARLGSASEPAPAAMRRLNRILGFSELRHGSALLHFPIQALTLWDFHVLFALDRWRRSAGAHVRDWLVAAGEVDVLSCFAAVRHDNPAWCQPQLHASPGTFSHTLVATGLAHPLIPDDRRVPNDVTVGPPGTVLLITGSNMSGKSTLLRALGVNAVLAQAGAPVCATALRMPPADLASSIRIQDSLERGVSYFMAALARLKRVVDAAEREPEARVLLYLLDEILQGTNSAERGIAVQAVARHLLDARAIGAITTHDLNVASEEPLRSKAVLVHFTETVDEGGNMGFDYTLRPGLATSRNALRLMKLIGID